MAILVLKKRIAAKERPPIEAGIGLRSFLGLGDAIAWLELHQVCFSLPRKWTMKDFQREFVSKPWWSPQSMWFASSTSGGCLGSVTLGVTSHRIEGRNLPSVHWLMVRPDARRRGIGRFLVWQLEDHCRRNGENVVLLETRSDWEEANQFYGTVGYEELNRIG